MLICTLSSGFCATTLDEEFVSTHFTGAFSVVLRIWRSTFSHGLLHYNIGLLSLQYLHVSRLSGLPCNCMMTIIQVLVLKSLSVMNDCEHRLEYSQ